MLLTAFSYVLRKIFRSNRRSRAGYTKNTVSLDTHMYLLEGVLVWTVAWGLFQVFAFKDGSADLPPPSFVHSKLVSTAVTTAVVYGCSEAFALLILLLLVRLGLGALNEIAPLCAAFALLTRPRLSHFKVHWPPLPPQRRDSESIGSHNLERAGLWAAAYGILVAGAIAGVMVFNPGSYTDDNPAVRERPPQPRLWRSTPTSRRACACAWDRRCLGT